MRIVYLTWGETPRQYGVYGSQVFRIIEEISRAQSAIEISLVAFVPAINSAIKDIGFGKAAPSSSKLFGFQRNILPAYQGHFYNHKPWFYSLQNPVSHYALYKRLRKLQPQIIHARSYHAAFAAIEVRKRYKLNYKVVFDARGIFPEETLLKKRGGNPNDPRYLFWKRIENYILDHSDICISVSDTMHDMLESTNANPRHKTIYLAADVKAMQKGIFETVRKNGMRPTLGYVGALNTNSWHSPEGVLGIFMKIQEIGFRPTLKIVTKSSHADLRQQLLGIGKDRLIIKATHSASELAEEISDFDIGLLPFRETSSNIEAAVGKTILGTKTVEYLAAGIPVLVNDKCGGADKLIKKYNLGISYNTQNEKYFSNENITEILNIDRREIAKKAYQLFDIRNIAKQYIGIYKEVLMN